MATPTTTIPRHPRLLIAVDPGTNDMGVAVFRGIELFDTFSIHTPVKSKDGDLRAYAMIKQMEERLENFLYCTECERSHSVLTYEDPQFFKPKGVPRPISPVLRMAGMLTFWAMSRGLQLYKYPVSTIKTSIAGRANATKEEVEQVVNRKIDLPSKNLTSHVYDAISVGIHHLEREMPGCYDTPTRFACVEARPG